MCAQLCSGGSRVDQVGHAVADPGFPRPGVANLRSGANLLFGKIFAKNFHGNEGNWTEKGAHVRSAPWIRKCPNVPAKRSPEKDGRWKGPK